jgi:hypothetical protein
MKQQLQHQLLSNQQQICVRSNFERKFTEHTHTQLLSSFFFLHFFLYIYIFCSFLSIYKNNNNNNNSNNNFKYVFGKIELNIIKHHLLSQSFKRQF